MRPSRLAGIVLSLPLSLLVVGFRGGPAAPAGTAGVDPTSVIRFPIDATYFVPCANGGAGETLEIRGTLVMVTHESEDAGGGYHFHTTTSPQNVRAVGLDSGNQYRGVGVTSERFNLVAGETHSYENVYRLVGMGDAETYSRHDVVHVTLDASGESRASVSSTRITCR